jgi:uncharacterized metal-binding protein YceD (DUF177 family)
MAGAPEFCRPVPLAQLGREPFTQEIAALPDERAALARRFGLLSLDRLSATVTLRREAGAMILLEARFEAAFAQECIVTLEPVAGAVCDSFALRYGPPEAAEPALDLSSEEPAFEPLAADAIDIGEAVAQELSLSLPPSPRLPEADGALAEAAAGEPAFGPFAVLRGLAKD